MPTSITTDQVWQEIDKQLFAVMGMITARGEVRTAGIVYAVRNRRLYFTTSRDTWKAKHITENPQVSFTVTIPKRIPFMPWIRIPAATITFQGQASIHGLEDVDSGIHETLLSGLEVDEAFVANTCVIRVQPEGQFVTYGVGVHTRTMRKPAEAGGRVGI